jgi:hypothetical protein
MDLTDIFSEPVLRRCWLLSKALENTSFGEALELAQIADEFLRANRPVTSAPIPTKPLVRSSNGPQCASPLTSVPSLPVGPRGDHLRPTDIDHDEAATVVVELRGSLGGSSDYPSDNLRDNREIASQVAVEDSLLVLARQDDIVRYLRQRDDVVVSTGANSFLINGRFRLNFDELLARANKMRQRQGKPLFSRFSPLTSSTVRADPERS